MALQLLWPGAVYDLSEVPLRMATQKLELDFNQELARWSWRAERLGWLAWAAIIVAALLGFLGGGPFDGARAISPNEAVSVDYKRFVHHHDMQELEFTVQPSETQTRAVALTLPTEFLDSVQIDRIEPTPVRTSAGGDVATFIFERSGTPSPTRIVFHLQYDTFGKVQGSARVPGDEPVRFVQTVYP